MEKAADAEVAFSPMIHENLPSMFKMHTYPRTGSQEADHEGLTKPVVRGCKGGYRQEREEGQRGLNAETQHKHPHQPSTAEGLRTDRWPNAGQGGAGGPAEVRLYAWSTSGFTDDPQRHGSKFSFTVWNNYFSHSKAKRGSKMFTTIDSMDCTLRSTTVTVDCTLRSMTVTVCKYTPVSKAQGRKPTESQSRWLESSTWMNQRD